MTASALRAKCHAGGGPWLERRVRAHSRLCAWATELLVYELPGVGAVEPTDSH
jgi:hypothetical protein